jgi:hypothetical protein
MFETSVSTYESPCDPFMYFPSFFAIFLYLDLYHLGNHRSPSGSGPGFLGSKPLGYFTFLFRFFGIKNSAPPAVYSITTSLSFLSLRRSGIPSSISF